MTWLVAVVLGLAWAFGMANAYTAGGYIHLLPAAAILLVTFGIFRHLRARRVR